MKYTKYILIFVLLFSIVLGTQHQKAIKQTEYMLDTVITITAYGKNAKNAVSHTFEEIKRLDNLLSAYNKDSVVAKINSLASFKPVKIDNEVYSLIKKAVLISEKTGGAFDITLKPVSDLWGIGTEDQRVPSDTEIKNALNLTGYKKIVLDDKNSSVFFKEKGMAIDLGAIAKGYVSERAASVLKANGIENALLDLGGNVSVIGRLPLSFLDTIKYKSRFRPFVIGIQNPDGTRGEIIHTYTALGDDFIITSGSYERYFEENGKKYHHIIDPKTGKPAESGIKSATVVTGDGALGDALSTASFVLGKDGVDTISEYSDLLIIIDDENNIYEYRKD